MRKMTLSASALILGLAAGSASAAGNNELVVDQIGDGNFGDTSQVGTNNETVLQQLGNRNTGALALTGSAVRENLFVQQNTGGNFAQYGGDGKTLNDNDFGVIQKGGNYNTAAFSQTDGNSYNQIGVIQDGSQNVVGGGASGNAGRGWGGNTVTNSQLALSMVNQSTSMSSLLAAPTDDAPISGDNNFVGVAQLGDRNIMGVNVNGNNNTIAGGPSNLNGGFDTAIDFNGDSSTSVFSPNAMIDGEAHTDGLFPGGGVSGYLDSQSNGLAVQLGSDNQAALTQFGDNNIIAFGQISNDNRAQITQVGNGNYQQAVQN